MNTFHLHLRTRVQPYKGSEAWQEATFEETIPAAQTALLLCDVWDNHWCPGAAQRVNEMVPTMNAVVQAAREKGVQIIHAPSDTLDFYADSPHRKKMAAFPRVATPPPLDIRDDIVEFPIDDSDGGCDTPPEQQNFPVNTGVWTRQHPGIEITGEDVISDKGDEVYSLLRAKNIQTLLLMGVHTNMCVLGRSFSIRQMTRWGVRCVLVRDLTDAMYNPKMRPYVDHFAGTELVIQHIERFWCPTMLSTDISGKPPFRFREDTRS